MDRLGGGRPRGALLSAFVAFAALVGGWTWGAMQQPAGFDSVRESISALAAVETPHRWIMTSALVLTGVAHVGSALMLPGLRGRGRWVLGGAGLATVAVALAPLPSRGESSVPHLVVAALSFVLLAAWPWFAAGASRAPLLRRRVARPVSAFLLLLVASLAVGNQTGMPFGAHERIVAGLLALWPFATAISAWWALGHRVGGRTVRGLVTVAVLTVGCAAGGVAATRLAPATADTLHYSAQVQLSLDPRESTRLVARTLFGDIDVGFTGLAPGIEVTPQVKASITDVLSRPGVTISNLQPGPLELNAAIRRTARDVGLRFAVGALAVGALALGAGSLARRRRPRSTAVARAAAAWVIACGATGVAIWQTYQPDRQHEFTSTGVLGTVQRNQSLLTDVEARTAQVTPYLRNLIALSSALQDKYSPSELTQPVALRVLLVSDLHAGNQYALMRTIVEQEDIDLVVDTGDLVNFGTVAEGEASGMFAGIASLPVPYLFTRGNHDANSATDHAILDRLATVPNVVLLQPDKQDYTVVDAGGLRIGGFNDPRWFGDDGKRSKDKQQPAKKAFEAAFAQEPSLDLLVSHEPWAVQDVPRADVLVNGHMHTPDLEGNRIQAGTFTGGGPLTHFVGQENGEELVGQPSAFDVLAFGETCRLTSVTRYSYRNVIEGRPAYDDVSLLNGSRIDMATDPDRTCTRPTKGEGPLDSVTLREVRAPSPEAAPAEAG
jgi:predicted phosphodiesterase